MKKGKSDEGDEYVTLINLNVVRSSEMQYLQSANLKRLYTAPEQQSRRCGRSQ